MNIDVIIKTSERHCCGHQNQLKNILWPSQPGNEHCCGHQKKLKNIDVAIKTS